SLHLLTQVVALFPQLPVLLSCQLEHMLQIREGALPVFQPLRMSSTEKMEKKQCHEVYAGKTSVIHMAE
ncbi:hypothetical protein ACSLNR_29250, partial [Escherichia coli]